MEIAEMLPARQSSTQYGLGAWLAVHPNASDCSHTFAENSPWWRVDLGTPARVNRVVLELSSDCSVESLHDVRVSVGRVEDPSLDTEGEGTHSVVCGHGLAVDRSVATSVECVSTGGEPGVVGTFVSVLLDRRASVLSLSRVRVFGVFEQLPENETAVESSGNWTDIASAWMKTSASSLAPTSQPSNPLDSSHHSCAITTEQNNPWWQLDLGITQTIDSVSFMLPSEFSFSSLEVRVGQSQLDQGNSNPLCDSMRIHSQRISVSCHNATGRFVNIRAPRSNATLAVCSISVFAASIPPVPLVNLATLKPTTVSVPSLLSTPCLSSAQSDMPKITIDLQGSSFVDHVLLRMGAINIPLLTISVTDATSKAVVFCGPPHFATAESLVFAKCPNNVVSSHVTITANGWNQVLSVCEIEIWGRVKPGQQQFSG